MDQYIDMRKEMLADWLRKESEYSEISGLIKRCLRQLENDSLSNEQWENISAVIERYYKSLSVVSQMKGELARAAAGLPPL